MRRLEFDIWESQANATFSYFAKRFFNEDYAACTTDGGSKGKLFIIVTENQAIETWLILEDQIKFRATGEYSKCGISSVVERHVANV
jgi:hypothetical protein